MHRAHPVEQVVDTAPHGDRHQDGLDATKLVQGCAHDHKHNLEQSDLEDGDFVGAVKEGGCERVCVTHAHALQQHSPLCVSGQTAPHKAQQMPVVRGPGVPHHQDHHGCCYQDDDDRKDHVSQVWHAGAACTTAAGQHGVRWRMHLQQAQDAAAVQRQSW